MASILLGSIICFVVEAPLKLIHGVSMSSQREQLQPEQLLHFVELDEFGTDWKKLGLDVELDLAELQHELMLNPLAGDLVPGTGGLRKLRFSPPRWRMGKRGALRVCYAYFPEFWTILLMMAYAKGVQASLAVAEKQGILKFLARTEKWLHQHRKQKE